MPFGGQTYDPAQDKDRLTRQLWAVKNLMADGKWRTLAAITEVVEAPQQSVSARGCWPGTLPRAISPCKRQ